MKLIKYLYKKIKKQPAPYYYDYTFLTIVGKPIRKWICQVIAPNCVFNNIRILLYRFCGFKIGKHVFIGMRCYLDDMCYDLLTIGNNVVISYGVFFACHGKGQGHNSITIEDGTYIGMNSSIISKNTETSKSSGGDNGVVIGKHSIIGACTLVNKSIPENTTAVGIPCRIIKTEENTGSVTNNELSDK